MKFLNIFNRKSELTEENKQTLDSGLHKTKTGLVEKITRAIAGKSTVDDDVLDDLEATLITSDVGVDTTLEIINRIKTRVERDKYVQTAELNAILRDEITRMLLDAKDDTKESEELDGPYVIMVVGVNGVGKTTTIGKLANMYKQRGLKVYLGAADTFRAAAVEQLQIWADRVEVPIVKQQMGSDPASVAYNKVGLMNELSKIKNVMKKLLPYAPNEVLLVLDGSTGQNAFEQAKQFSLATEVNSLAITKLDGTARGGVVIGISHQFNIPVKYIGLGEKMTDLQQFDKKAFVDSLFDDKK